MKYSFGHNTYNNSFVLSHIEFILGMGIPKGKRDEPLAPLLWSLGCHSNHSDKHICFNA